MVTKPQSAQIHPGPGFRIREKISRPKHQLIERFKEYGTPEVSDMLNRLYTMSSPIRNFINDAAISGPACTRQTIPGR